ncbi:VOC family protein [Oryzifoliimicrobium ureilyticus]|uniref:VOC family protein n=1 Tax=Oryzifoliimicrobium ureilyticus TaxID=3113724 RepID=UPI00307610DC
MTVLRIVPNLAAPELDHLRAFYADLFDLEVVMDHGWIATLSSGKSALTQISIASEGGSGTPVPALSIEVDNVKEVYRRAKEAGHGIAYEMADEPWGVRRFFVKDPAGTLVNVLQHMK